MNFCLLVLFLFVFFCSFSLSKEPLEPHHTSSSHFCLFVCLLTVFNEMLVLMDKSNLEPSAAHLSLGLSTSQKLFDDTYPLETSNAEICYDEIQLLHIIDVLRTSAGSPGVQTLHT